MNESDNNPENRIALFQKREIRRTIYNNEWWFVIAAQTDSVDPQGYIKDMLRRNLELSKGWGQIATPFPSRLPEASKEIIDKNMIEIVPHISKRFYRCLTIKI